MFLSKLKQTVNTAVLAVVIAGSGLLLAAPPEKVAPPKVKTEGKLMLLHPKSVTLLNPDGTEDDSSVSVPHIETSFARAVSSPDGKWVAYEKEGEAIEPAAPKDGEKARPISKNRFTLHLVELGTDEDAKPLSLPNIHLTAYHWLGDGKKLHVQGFEISDTDVVSRQLQDWIWDPSTGKRTSLKVPASFYIRVISPDGKTAVLDECKVTDEEWHQRAHLWTIGSDDKPSPLFEVNQGFDNLRPQFSPDGQRLLCRLTHYGTYTPVGNGGFRTSDFKFNHLLVVDLKTKKQTVVKDLGERPNWRIRGLAWSPDGKQVAYAESHDTRIVPPGQMLFRVTVTDADGTNEKEAYSKIGPWLLGFTWR